MSSSTSKVDNSIKNVSNNNNKSSVAVMFPTFAHIQVLSNRWNLGRQSRFLLVLYPISTYIHSVYFQLGTVQIHVSGWLGILSKVSKNAAALLWDSEPRTSNSYLARFQTNFLPEGGTTRNLRAASTHTVPLRDSFPLSIPFMPRECRSQTRYPAKES